jgi:ApaG protein
MAAIIRAKALSYPSSSSLGLKSTIMSMYSATTKGIRIDVSPVFLADQSDPANDDYIWSYTVEIQNTATMTVQLTGRRWQITDRNGITQVVQGAGVVGEQPILRQGDTFTYTSGCPLSTPSGIMRGTYRMQTMDGDIFEAEVPAFSLDSPFDVRVMN